VAELQRSIEFPPLKLVDNRGSRAESGHAADGLRLPERMQNLGVVIERLWRFYEAMHSGKPVQNIDEVLPQMGTALKRAIGPGDSV
jgi:hypothetical protein